MKVIKTPQERKATKPQPWRQYRCTCSSCKAILEYDTGDLNQNQFSSRLFWFECGHCKYRLVKDTFSLLWDNICYWWVNLAELY